jgi:hypothetical protein
MRKERMTAYLEGNNGQRHHAQPDHGQSIFTPQETGVEVAHSRNHYPDEGGRSNDPGHVTKVVNKSRLGCWVIVINIASCDK